MSTSYEHEMERTLAQYHEQRAGLADLQRALGEVSCSATAPRKVVTVSVGSQGEVTSLKFPTEAYKRMVPAELAEVILTTINDARSQALDETAKLLGAIMPPQFDARAIVEGKADLQAMMPAEPRTAADILNGITGN
ncbi:YbaB/EbfC family nucleoid-associated protein [Actinosynnema sp. CS-041913]|uniref:YbaB/EbfC family nucleoid-associated protein n=1 Tax=Actinosynnema sp. CS-041913 TaxID=3239917 RepID=UPI003D917EB9